MTGTIEAFAIGQDDVSDKFQIPQKLYGREQEIAALLAAFDRVSQGTRELLLVAGYAGIGKSALVHEIHKPITEKRGYFIAGKLDQFTRNIPYSALIQAFQGLVRQLLSEPEERIRNWKENLLEALGPNGQVIIAVIPEFELIVGPQPAVPDLPPAQAQNRFNLVFQQFVRTCATAKHPLVFFLDDLQWADLSSLTLIDRLINDPRMASMLVIGAYRDNEVTDAHPLMLKLHDIHQVGATVTTIRLKPLSLEHVNHLIADTLHAPMDMCTPLAGLSLHKTGGNPFFLRQFLQALYEEGFLEFKTTNGVWTWELEEIRHAEMTENVIDLMAGKIQKLPEQTQQVLTLAACIGNQFDLQTLSIVHEQLPADTMHDLREALQEELVIPLDDTYKYIGTTDDWQLSTRNSQPATRNPHFKFLHDRVQQAAYSLIEEAHKRAVHLRIGRLILAKTPEPEQEEKIFEIVNHLNIAKDLITEQPEKDGLAELNLKAGKKAEISAAYQMAFKYLQVGIELSKPDGWQRQYEITLALHVEATEAAYLIGDFECMEQLAQVVLERARTLLEKMKVYEIKLQAYIAQNKLLEAVQTAILVLKLLGVTFPEKPNKFHIWLGFINTKIALRGKTIENLSTLPEMSDPYKLAAMRMMSIVGSAYYAVPELLPLIIFKGVSLSIKHGNAPVSAYVYAGYGLILCSVVGDIDTGYRFGTLALRLLERLNTKEFKAKTLFMVNTFIKHWKDHVRETLPPLLEAYQTALETGDLEYAALSVHIHTSYSNFIGKALAEVEREMGPYTELMGQLKQETARNYQQMEQQAVLNLMGKATPSTGSEQVQDLSPWQLVGGVYDEEQMLPLHLQANDRTAIFSLYCIKLFLCYLFQAYPQAVKNADMAAEYLDGGTGMLGFPLFHFYDSLTRLAVFPDASGSEQKSLLKKVAANQKKMKKWAHHAPMNHLHKFYLVEAERARVLGKDLKAMDYYEKAIELAREHEYLNEEALANELAARFYFAKGKEKIARTYMREAHYCYLKWGTIAKVKHLERTYPELLRDGRHPSTGSGQRLEGGAHLTLIDTTPVGTDSGVLDLTTVMKASHMLSREVVLEQILTKLMQIVIENAGAEKGMLLLKEEDEWVIKAEKNLRPDRFLKPVRSAFPTAIINYVVRTKEPVVLEDAAQYDQFAQDKYILAHQPRSVLCIPLLNQANLTGILYLENNLTSGAFTPERVEVLKLLSSQAAISLENAMLYSTLEQKVAERTTELMEAKKAADAANQAKSEFLSRVSHEVRTPLNIILGYTQLLMRNRNIMDEHDDTVETIYRSGKYLLTMINDLLDLSKIETRQIDLKPTNVYLPEFLRHIIEMIHIQAQQKNIVFNHDISPDLPAVIRTDEQRLRQILLNLLNNAMKFTEKGSVTLRVKRLMIDNYRLPIEKHQGSTPNRQSSIVNLQFSIEDTGIGIPPEHLKDIFLPFYQVGNPNFKREGTGLGLAISQQLTHILGGKLHVKSCVGHGTTFWFDLEFAVIEDYAGKASAESYPKLIDNSHLKNHPHRKCPVVGFKGSKRKILLVDDNDENRDLLRKILSPLGFELAEALNGSEALKAAKEWRADLILLDLLMPVMDGVETIRQLRQISHLNDVIVIGVSASVFPQVREKSMEAGCDDFLAKPVHIEELLNCLHHYLELEWIYEDTSESSPPQTEVSPLVGPPHEVLLELLEGAKGRYITDIRKSITKMKASDPKFIPFAIRIEHLAKDFQFKQIIELIESLMKGAGS